MHRAKCPNFSFLEILEKDESEYTPELINNIDVFSISSPLIDHYLTVIIFC